MTADLAANTLKSLLTQNINKEVAVTNGIANLQVPVVTGETRQTVKTKLIDVIVNKLSNDSAITHISNVLSITEYQLVEGVYKQVPTFTEQEQATLLDKLSLCVTSLIIA